MRFAGNPEGGNPEGDIPIRHRSLGNPEGEIPIRHRGLGVLVNFDSRV